MAAAVYLPPRLNPNAKLLPAFAKSTSERIARELVSAPHVAVALGAGDRRSLTTAPQELARLGLVGKPSPWSIAIPAGSVWLVWYVMLGLLRRLAGGIDHPPVDDRPLPRSRALLFWTVVVSFILIFMPTPIRETSARRPSKQSRRLARRREVSPKRSKGQKVKISVLSGRNALRSRCPGRCCSRCR